MNKRITAMILLVGLIVCVFSACQSGQEDVPQIGVLKFGAHPSLDNCEQGIVDSLRVTLGDGAEIHLELGNFDRAACDTIAKNMVAKNYDIIFAIATPAALAAYAAAEGTDIPVIFCAVSDPVAAGLLDDPNAPGDNCTGTSDQLDLEGQLELITAMQPGVETIGVLYTTGEANSISQLGLLRELVKPYGITLEEQGVQGASDIPQAAATLAAKVDCISNFTDNNVVSNLQVVLEKASEIPVYGSEIEQVKNGCIAAASIDYVALGKETAAIGLRVLDGEKAGDIPVAFITASTPVINTEVAERFGFSIPVAYADALFVVTE